MPCVDFVAWYHYFGRSLWWVVALCFIGMDVSPSTLDVLGLCAAGLHAAQALAVVGLTVWLDANPRGVGVFEGGHLDV